MNVYMYICIYREIVVDIEKDLPYDIVMTVVDLNYGAYGIYNFYKMQVCQNLFYYFIFNATICLECKHNNVFC